MAASRLKSNLYHMLKCRLDVDHVMVRTIQGGPIVGEQVPPGWPRDMLDALQKTEKQYDDIAQRCDPSGDVQRLHEALDQVKALAIKLEEKENDYNQLRIEDSRKRGAIEEMRRRLTLAIKHEDWYMVGEVRGRGQN